MPWFLNYKSTFLLFNYILIGARDMTTKLRLREATAFGITDFRLFQLAASCVQTSERAVAKAIMRRARFHRLPVMAAKVNEVQGGYSALVDSRQVLVGTLGFMRKQNIPMTNVMGIMRLYISRGFLVRFVAINGNLAGILGFVTLE